MIELLLVIGIIAILASIVIVAINPTKQLSSTRDAKRRHEANQIEKALNQYLIDKGTFPVAIPEGSSAVKPVCREGQSDASCLDFDLLTPDYLVSTPQDATETNAFFSGYEAYVQSGRPQVTSTYLGGITLITNGLVGYWKFNETSGTVAADSSGNGNGGTHTNGPTISTTVAPTLFTNARSLSFDGTNDYVDAGLLSSFSFIQNTGIFSIAFWAKTNAPGSPQYWMGTSPTSSEKGFYFGLWPDGRYTIHIARGGYVLYSQSSSSMVSDSNWHHIAVTGNGTSVTFYVDGVGVADTNTMEAMSSGDSTRTLNIGKINNYNSEHFNGLMDDVRIYNRALTPAEITQIASGNG